MLKYFHQYKRKIQAATGVEYALMAAGISMTIMFAVFFFGETIQETFIVMTETITSFLQEAG